MLSPPGLATTTTTWTTIAPPPVPHEQGGQVRVEPGGGGCPAGAEDCCYSSRAGDLMEKLQKHLQENLRIHGHYGLHGKGHCKQQQHNHRQGLLNKTYGLITVLSGASTVAIDNKIEQAMDLVKSHLMFAVREEVEVLKEQIKELLEKNSQLECENSIYKAAASPETITKVKQQQQQQQQQQQPPSSTTS